MQIIKKNNNNNMHFPIPQERQHKRQKINYYNTVQIETIMKVVKKQKL